MSGRLDNREEWISNRITGVSKDKLCNNKDDLCNRELSSHLTYGILFYLQLTALS